jgi:organic radical activating enzyme
VATGDLPAGRNMDHDRAKEIIAGMARAGVGGISFSAGEPFLYFKQIAELVKLCSQIGIYTRIVTNSFWAKTAASSDHLVSELKKNGLCQLRGITNIASYTGMQAREIITYSKCELCRKLFNSAETLTRLRTELSRLTAWSR